LNIPFESYSIWLNLLIFAAAAGLIWYGGTKLERYADAISLKTGVGQAFIGLILLAAATSLPEVATTVTATLNGNTTLAVSNLLGGVIVQTAVLAVADVSMSKGALTRFTPRFGLLIEGVGLIMILAVVSMAAALDTITSIPISLAGWNLRLAVIPISLPILYFLMMYLTWKYEGRPRWQPVIDGAIHHEDDTDEDETDDADPSEASDQPEAALSKLLAYFGGFSLLVLIGGWAVAETGEAIAVQTGLGASFIGATLVAFSTSLPELSTTITAVRRGNFSMAVSNIFGSNAFDVSLILLVSLLSGGQLIFQEVTAFTMFAAALGIFMTGIYLWGMLEWEDRTVLRMGWDSAAVVILYLIGSFALYQLS
jgi:cation:H+ antiporter